jgi:hypothetical protein
MIKFMVIGPPRSGTAWASVWLNAYHDPLWDYYYADLDVLDSGICCTGLGLFPDWVNRHKAPKVILHRDCKEVNASLARLGLPGMDPYLLQKLDQLDGLHVHWTELFSNAAKIWNHLIDFNFDPERHKRLKMLKITTDWKARRLAQDPAVKAKYAQHGFLQKV